MLRSMAGGGGGGCWSAAVHRPVQARGVSVVQE